MTDTLLKVASTDEGFYRAEISEGTCNPVYSDTAAVVPDTASATVIDPDEIDGTTFIERNDSIFTFTI